jgi:NO-binding membrane sensor protein with MHYT domain
MRAYPLLQMRARPGKDACKCCLRENAMVGGHGSFNVLLVVLSYVIAASGAFTALILARESVKVQAEERLPWVAWSAVIMGGIGIWSMHFVGMMAWDASMPVSYDIMRTVLSMLLAILSTGIGFAIVGLASRSLLAILLAGTFMGAGVAVMHYTGMAAMRMPATITYDMTLVWASVGVAISASCVALWMAFFLTARWQMIVAALVAGVAVCGMHYLGMLAVKMVHDPDAPEPLPTALSPVVVASGLFLLSLLVLAVGLALTREQAIHAEPPRVSDDGSAPRLDLLR